MPDSFDLLRKARSDIDFRLLVRALDAGADSIQTLEVRFGLSAWRTKPLLDLCKQHGAVEVSDDGAIKITSDYIPILGNLLSLDKTDELIQEANDAFLKLLRESLFVKGEVIPGPSSPGASVQTPSMLLRGALASQLAAKGNLNWLDIGCGEGRALSILPSLGDSAKRITYVGVDSDSESIKVAEEYAKSQRLDGVKLGIGFATNLSQGNDEFDLVTAVNLMHEIPPRDIPTVLSEFNRVCKKDGHVIVFDMEHLRIRERDFWEWSRGDYEGVLESIGYNQTEYVFQEVPARSGPCIAFTLRKKSINQESASSGSTEIGRILQSKIHGLTQRIISMENDLGGNVTDIDAFANITDSELREKGRDFGRGLLELYRLEKGLESLA